MLARIVIVGINDSFLTHSSLSDDYTLSCVFFSNRLNEFCCMIIPLDTISPNGLRISTFDESRFILFNVLTM